METREKQRTDHLDPRIQGMDQNLSTFLVLQNLNPPRYAGDEPNPRPIPPATLSDVKRDQENSIQRALTIWHIDDLLSYAFYNNRFKHEPGSTIPLAKTDFWWFVSPWDIVLLSDKVTHHYTFISEIDREAERVYFADLWPDRFFLRSGLNVAGVAAHADEGKVGLGISRREFEKVIVGLVTKGTTGLPADYFRAHPQQREQFGPNLNFGLAMLDVEREAFCRTAAPYLKSALQIAEREADVENIMPIASKLFLALSVAELFALRDRDPLFAKPYGDDLRAVLQKYSRNELLKQLGVDELCRIANASGWVQRFDLADELFSLAISRDPEHAQARYLRASVAHSRNDYQTVVSDCGIALAANERLKSELNASLTARDPRDWMGIGRDKSALSTLSGVTARYLALRCNAYVKLGQLESAEADARAAIEIAPDEATGYGLMALIAGERQQRLEAANWFREAARREQDPARKALFETEAIRLAEKKQD